MVDLFLLETEKRGVAGRVTINDVPIRVWHDGADFNTTDPVNQWIRPGVNRIAARLDPPPAGPGAPQRLRVVVKRMVQRDGDRSAPEEIARLDLMPSGAPEQVVWPLTATADFNPATPPPSRVWPELTPLGTVEAVRGEALQLLAALHAALDAENLDQVSALLRTKALDVAACYGLPIEQALHKQREFFAGLMEARGWAMAPLDPDAVELHPVAEGRMLWVTGPGNAPVLRSVRGSGVKLELPIYLARLRGALMVVR